MTKIAVTTRDGHRREIDASPGTTLKDALMAGGVDEINAMTSCGGCCSCGTCHVYVEPADVSRLGPMGSQEDDLLYVHDERRRPNSRLSCQVRLTPELDRIAVTIAPEL